MTAVKMRFPADREFVFEFSYSTDSPSGGRNRVIDVRPGETLPLLREGGTLLLK